MRKLHLFFCSLAIVLLLPAALVFTQQRAQAPARGGATAAQANAADWPTAGGDNSRSNANMAATGSRPRTLERWSPQTARPD
jgi:hypothetical protein